MGKEIKKKDSEIPAPVFNSDLKSIDCQVFNEV